MTPPLTVKNGDRVTYIDRNQVTHTGWISEIKPVGPGDKDAGRLYGRFTLPAGHGWSLVWVDELTLVTQS